MRDCFENKTFVGFFESYTEISVLQLQENRTYLCKSLCVHVLKRTLKLWRLLTYTYVVRIYNILFIVKTIRTHKWFIIIHKIYTYYSIRCILWGRNKEALRTYTCSLHADNRIEKSIIRSANSMSSITDGPNARSGHRVLFRG